MMSPSKATGFPIWPVRLHPPAGPTIRVNQLNALVCRSQTFRRTKQHGRLLNAEMLDALRWAGIRSIILTIITRMIDAGTTALMILLILPGKLRECFLRNARNASRDALRRAHGLDRHRRRIEPELLDDRGIGSRNDQRHHLNSLSFELDVQ